MFRVSSLAACVAATLLSGCANGLSPVGVGLITDVKGPITATTAQGGKVNAPAGYKKGGLVKVNGAGDVKLKEPGKPRMPKMPAVGKKGTDSMVKAAIAKAKKPTKKVK